MVNHLNDIKLNNLREFHTKFERRKVFKFKWDDEKEGSSTSKKDNIQKITTPERVTLCPLMKRVVDKSKI